MLSHGLADGRTDGFLSKSLNKISHCASRLETYGNWELLTTFTYWTLETGKSTLSLSFFVCLAERGGGGGIFLILGCSETKRPKPKKKSGVHQTTPTQASRQHKQTRITKTTGHDERANDAVVCEIISNENFSISTNCALASPAASFEFFYSFYFSDGSARSCCIFLCLGWPPLADHVILLLAYTQAERRGLDRNTPAGPRSE